MSKGTGDRVIANFASIRDVSGFLMLFNRALSNLPLLNRRQGREGPRSHYLRMRKHEKVDKERARACAQRRYCHVCFCWRCAVYDIRLNFGKLSPKSREYAVRENCTVVCSSFVRLSPTECSLEIESDTAGCWYMLTCTIFVKRAEREEFQFELRYLSVWQSVQFMFKRSSIDKFQFLGLPFARRFSFFLLELS